MGSASSVDLLFAMTGAHGLCGGIPASNRNVLRALTELAQETGRGLTVYSFLEGDMHRPDSAPAWVRFRTFRGNKLAFAADLVTAAIRRPILLFDHVVLSAPVLPLAASGLAK